MNSDRLTRDQLIRGMIAELTEDFRIALDSATRTCVNCMHFDEIKEECSLVGTRPPAKVIASGCNVWEHDGTVPF